MSESCEIYIKPHVACHLIEVDVALKGHGGMLPVGGRCLRAAQNIPCIYRNIYPSQEHIHFQQYIPAYRQPYTLVCTEYY